MEIDSIISLSIAVGTAAATWYFWAVKMNAEAPNLDAAFFPGGAVKLRTGWSSEAGDAPTSWIGMECRVVVFNLSTLPNALLGAAGVLRLPDGGWASGKPPRDLIVGSPTLMPVELPPQQATEIKVWVWVEVPRVADVGATERARQCLAWPPVLRVNLDALDGRRFTLELPLAEEA